MSAIMAELRVMSSLEKCFPEVPLIEYPEVKDFTMLKNQTLSFQIGVCRHGGDRFKDMHRLRLSGSLADCAEVRLVALLPSMYACRPDAEGEYLRRDIYGMYPELLRPLHYRGAFTLLREMSQCLWIDIRPNESIPRGNHVLTLELLREETGEVLTAETVNIRMTDIALPPQKTIHTEWFHTDCIAQVHKVKVFSEAHWKLIENYMRMAVENGINMILAPVFTPALDTYIGGERLTTQLLDITVEQDGSYTFDFGKMDRWFDLCEHVGVEYYEIPHFFTQWGAKHAPKFVAKVNGRKKRIFGWDTDARGEEYKNFLSQMIPALVAFLERRGVAERTFFHISDEPHGDEALEQYLACKNAVAPYLKNYPIIDALSDYAFYERGVLKKPVAVTCAIEPFLENKVPGLWAYYCGFGGAPMKGSVASSRMFSMPTARTRIIGVQLYLADIEGFLHWGYNFYNNERSYDAIDPYLFTDAELFQPSGDSCLVWPGEHGEVWGSLRLNAMREAMEDIRMLQLCESLYGRDATVAVVRELAGYDITFKEYPADAAFLLGLRERLIEMIESKM